MRGWEVGEKGEGGGRELEVERYEKGRRRGRELEVWKWEKGIRGRERVRG